MTRFQQIRAEILLAAYSARPLPLSPELIRRDANNAGRDYSQLEVTREIAFLVGSGLLASVQDPATLVTRYAITPAGVANYESQHPVE